MFLLSSCKKDRDNFVPYPLDGKISNLIAGLLSETSFFTFAPNTDHIITIDKISELKINASSMMELNEDNISLSWMNATSAIEMELLQLPNYSNGKYLQPLYTFDLETSQGETLIEISNQSPIELRIESDPKDGVSLFYLSNEGWSSVGNESLIYDAWTDANNIQKEGYIANITQKGWYTVANKVDLASETFSSFCIELSGEYTQGNTKSFVILENDVVVPMSRVMAQGTFCTTQNIPINQDFKLVVMSNLRADSYQMYYSEQQMENGLIVAPIMEEKSIDEIKSILEDI